MVLFLLVERLQSNSGNIHIFIRLNDYNFDCQEEITFFVHGKGHSSQTLVYETCQVDYTMTYSIALSLILFKAAIPLNLQFSFLKLIHLLAVFGNTLKSTYSRESLLLHKLILYIKNSMSSCPILLYLVTIEHFIFLFVYLFL